MSSCILDIGTGPGRLLSALRKVMPEAVLAGIDISPSMVRQAQRNLGMSGLNGRIHVQTADAASLPFADGIFSSVVSTGAFHHWKAPCPRPV